LEFGSDFSHKIFELSSIGDELFAFAIMLLNKFYDAIVFDEFGEGMLFVRLHSFDLVDDLK
jgi:hypothetical protein